MSLLRLVFDLTDSTKAVSQELLVPQKKTQLARYIDGISIGAYMMNNPMLGSIGAIAATGIYTIASGNLSDGDTLVIGGVTITAVTSSSPTSVQFHIGTTALISAQNCAATINALSTLLGLASATAAAGAAGAGVVTISAIVPGIIGNQITLSEVGSNSSVSSSVFGTGTGATAGAEGTVYNLGR